MNSESPLMINRREALKRAGLFLGATLSASTMSGVLQAQPKGRASKSKPKNLSRTEYGLVEAIADRILPKTDTPGAVDVGVPELIDILYGDYMTEGEKKTLTQGLSAVNKASRKAEKTPFAKLDGGKKDAVLRGIAESDSEFFKQIRELTISGYFTSEPVMKNVLNYDFIPGTWQGCVDVSEVGNVVWAHT